MGAFAAAMAMALVIDAALGWPPAVYRRIGHPITWIGALISVLETRWNTGAPSPRRLKGASLVVVVVFAVGVPAWLAQAAVPSGWPGIMAAAVLAWPWLAARSLYEHVAAVAAPLDAGDLESARSAVAMIVGRDPAHLDEAGIARAGLESLAENASDGVVAPLFWGALLGLPGLVAYKAINTLDSMIGHRSEKYRDFGMAAARLDDLVNLIPARLTGLVFAIISGRGAAFKVMWRDARQHRSPNAGWPEAAMAGALGVRLSGPREYGDQVADEPWLNPSAPDPDADAMRRGLRLYARGMVLCGLGLVGVALSW